MYNKSQLSKDQKHAKQPRKLPKPTDIDYVSKMGYRDDSPFNTRPYIDINTPTGVIDMTHTSMPLYANGLYLPPNSGMHQFDTTKVREVPVAEEEYAYLTDDEIAAYRDGGYVVEEMDMYQDGGITKLTPEEETQFQRFYNTLPDNLQSDDPSYDIRGYWDSEGRPAEFDYSQPKESDGYYHAYSINANTGEYLKAPTHPTFQHAVDEDRKIGWRPVTNIYGRNIATENPALIEPEHSFLDNTSGPRAFKDGGTDIRFSPKHNPANSFTVTDPRSMGTGGSYVDAQITHFQDGGEESNEVEQASILTKGPDYDRTHTVNPGAYIYPTFEEDSSNFYKYGYIAPTADKTLEGGFGFGLPKQGLEANFTGAVPTSSEDLNYWRGFYNANLSKQLGDVNLGLGVNTEITGQPTPEGFARDKMKFNPSISFRYNIPTRQDGGNTDPGNNALELHMFYDKDIYKKEEGGSYYDDELTDDEIQSLISQGIRVDVIE
jgi:hypothetical protein